MKPKSTYQQFNENQKEQIINLFNQGKTQKEIATIFGVPRRTMMKMFHHLGLKRSPREAVKLKNKGKLDHPDIILKIKEMRATNTLNQIAAEVGGSASAVQRICSKYGIELDRELFYEIQSMKMKSVWSEDKKKAISGSLYSELNDKNWLEEKYIKQNLSIGEIKNLLKGPNIGTISHHLKRHGIPLKPKDVYLRNQRRKTSIRKTVKTKWGNFTLQSQAECEFIASLDSTVKNVKNDPVVLKSEGSEYVPDFEVDGNYIEIKPPEYSKFPGINRQRFVKQLLIAQNNKVTLKCWYKGHYFNWEPLDDEDYYFCTNWKLIFKTPESCYDFLCSYGFHPPKWHKDRLLLGINNILKPGINLNANCPNRSVLNLIKHFSPHFWDSTHNGYNTIRDAFEIGNRSILKSAIYRLWTQKNNFNIYNLIEIIKKHYRDFTTVSIFKPWVAKFIYEKYLPNGGTIIDPCMGWGGRLLATVDSKYQYIGYDLNPNVIKSHNDLRSFIGSRIELEPRFILNDSSKTTFENGDLVFTSPPYDDCELYGGLNSTITKTEPILENIFKQFNITIALNLPKRQEKMCIKIAKTHNYNLYEKLEMKTASFMGRDKTYEPILIFKK